jgi:hypothetical protein
VAETHGEPLDHVERLVPILAEGLLALQKSVAQLATETRRGFDQVAKQFVESERKSRRTDERIDKMVAAGAKTDERIDKMVMAMGDTDERIDKLVIAMGEFIRRQNGK